MIEALSLADGQRSLGDPTLTYPLWPPLTEGCPQTSSDDVQYPLEVTFDYNHLPPKFFSQQPLPGMDRWSALLPPLLRGLSMGEGGTPLLPLPRLADWAGFEGELYVKDESRNPTWSHKDRINLCTVSAAARIGAPGVVIVSSGNNGASAAAYAARAGLPCVMIITAGATEAVQHFVTAYGAAVIGLPREARPQVMRDVVDRLGFHPLTTLTRTHTGHPFGPEGYKTLAYELYLQLGKRVPAAVFCPVGYGELFYGVWKGFDELHMLGYTNHSPRMIACEPAARAPLTRAVAEGMPAVHVPATPTDAYSIAVTVSGYRGVLTIQKSDGDAIAVSDGQMRAAQTAMAREGLWAELSSTSSVAALRQAVSEGEAFEGPVVCISTSSGFKDEHGGPPDFPEVAPDWASVSRTLRERYGITAQ